MKQRLPPASFLALLVLGRMAAPGPAGAGVPPAVKRELTALARSGMERRIGIDDQRWTRRIERFRRFTIEAMALGPVDEPPAPHRLERHLVPASGGVRLRTLVYHPLAPGPHPVIVCRTPYLEPVEGGESPIYEGAATYFCPQGYVVVIQSLRGKYGSEGRYELFSAGEIDDARHLFDWIQRQSWSNGRVGVFGVSHDGLTALAAACTNHPTLKLVFAGGAPASLWSDGFSFRGVTTALLLDYARYNETSSGPYPGPGFMERFLDATRSEPDASRYDDLLFGRSIRLWDELVQGLDRPGSIYWRNRQILDRLRESRVPIVHVAGWDLDGDRPDVFRNYRVMAATTAADRQRLVVGWWNHGQSGPYLDPARVMDPRLRELYDGWLKALLHDGADDLPPGPAVQIYVPGRREWRESDRWPLGGTVERDFFLAPAGAGADHGGLVSSRPPESSTASYRTEPASGEGSGVAFVTEPFAQGIQLMGEVEVEIHAAVDAPDMDLMAILYRPDAAPDWGSFNLFGSVRARFRDRLPERLPDLEPGAIVRYSLEFGPFAHVLEPGERLGLWITSQLPSILLRNTQTGESVHGATAFRPANQVIHMGSTHPSRIRLRVLP